MASATPAVVRSTKTHQLVDGNGLPLVTLIKNPWWRAAREYAAARANQTI